MYYVQYYANYTTNMYVYMMVVLKVISEVAFKLHYTCKQYSAAVIGNWMVVVWHP